MHKVSRKITANVCGLTQTGKLTETNGEAQLYSSFISGPSQHQLGLLGQRRRTALSQTACW
jgi:hypothetical protein